MPSALKYYRNQSLLTAILKKKKQLRPKLSAATGTALSERNSFKHCRNDYPIKLDLFLNSELEVLNRTCPWRFGNTIEARSIRIGIPLYWDLNPLATQTCVCDCNSKTRNCKPQRMQSQDSHINSTEGPLEKGNNLLRIVAGGQQQ